MVRENRVHIKLSDSELEKLDFIAQQEGASRSETLRKLTEREHQRLRIILEQADTED